MNKPLDIISNSLSPELGSEISFASYHDEIIESSVKAWMAFLSDDEENERAFSSVLSEMRDDNEKPNILCHSTLVENFINRISYEYEVNSLKDNNMTLPLPLTLLQCAEYAQVCDSEYFRFYSKNGKIFGHKSSPVVCQR